MKKLRLLMFYAVVYLLLGAIPVLVFQGAVLPMYLSIGMVIMAMVIFAINKQKFIGFPLCAFPLILVIGLFDTLFQSAIFQKGQINLFVAFLIGICSVSAIIAAVIAITSFYMGSGVFEYVEQEEHTVAMKNEN
jgi:hypothetical protein